MLIAGVTALTGLAVLLTGCGPSHKRGAESGDANEQYWYGVCLSLGINGSPKDQKQAVYWYRKAAEQGHVEAQIELGKCYEDGNGVEKDLSQMIYWYRKAADQGHAHAQYLLGWCYKSGHGVESNIIQARYWYGKAAKQGHKTAKSDLKELDR